VPLASGSGNKSLEVIRDGDMPPAGTNDPKRQYDTFDGRNAAAEDWIGYAFATPQTFGRVVFQEGMHFSRGGWFSSLTVHVRRNGTWNAVSSLAVTPAYPGTNNGRSYETYELRFAPVTGDAIRIWGRPGGKDAFISVGELQVYGAQATPVPTATVEPTARPTEVAPTGAATAVPTAVATPEPGLCGNDVRESGEQCDGNDAGGCAAGCGADCTCATSFTFPLDGWSSRWTAYGRGGGVTRETESGRVLVFAPRFGDDALWYPERPTLALPFPILSFTIAADDGARLQVGARGTNGRNYVLSYVAADGVPLATKRESRVPVGRYAGAPRTTLRDLRADFLAAFNVEFAMVTSVTLRGGMEVGDITVAQPGVLSVEPEPAAEIALPTSGWQQQGAGTVVEDEYDTVLDAPTIRTEPRDAKHARIAVSFPKRDQMAAAYRTFSLAVRDEEQLAIEVRVRVKKGIARLRYEANLAEPLVKGRKTTLPLVTIPLEGSPYRLVTIDLADDLAAVVPGASLDGVLGIRVQGKFRMGDVVLREALR
jgi:hypothetical protein